MGAHERRKGKRYENEVCEEIRAQLGIDARRKLGQERDSGNDIDVLGARLECKRRAKIANVYAWLGGVKEGCKHGEIGAVVMRADGQTESLVVLDLRTFLWLLDTRRKIGLPT